MLQGNNSGLVKKYKQGSAKVVQSVQTHIKTHSKRCADDKNKQLLSPETPIVLYLRNFCFKNRYVRNY